METIGRGLMIIVIGNAIGAGLFFACNFATKTGTSTNICDAKQNGRTCATVRPCANRRENKKRRNR